MRLQQFRGAQFDQCRKLVIKGPYFLVKEQPAIVPRRVV
jgi:hypothetical protein